MAATPQNQHRCVFVGNILYDATEEQLIKICEEVGPVVSFRLVTDRETGKPKGYGFCEYKDEETALSARRNLQGYEVNGRQLRADFAENDKTPIVTANSPITSSQRMYDGSDIFFLQGRGRPGIVTSADPQKQFGVSTVHRDQSLHQPVGDSVAMAAATVMSGALGSAQTASTTNQVELQSQTMLGTGPLTRHLAKMLRNQLTEIMSELKAMATQDKEQARMLLLAIPNLPKALFQAQIMLGMVSPQMLQMPNIRQASPVQSIQTLPGLPPLFPQNIVQYGLLPNNAHESQVPPLPMPLSQMQRPQQLVQNQVSLQQQGLPLPSALPQPLAGSSVRPYIQPSTPTPLNQQLQPPLSQQVPPIAYHGHQSATTQTSALMRAQFSAESYQAPLSTSSENMGCVSSLSGNTRMVDESIVDQMDKPSKMMKFNDGRATPVSVVPSQTSDISGRQTMMAQETLNSGRQANQMQLPFDVDSALLQQVLNLTPEQLNSLPPDQQRQVIQLQQMLRQAA